MDTQEIHHYGQGRRQLLKDIEDLYDDVAKFKFHDYKRQDILDEETLKRRLIRIANEITSGNYNN